MSLLAVRELCAGYGEARVLRGVSLDLASGETAALFGANGSGKSTLLRAVNGLIPYEGEILFQDEPLPTSADRVSALGIAHVPQGRGTFVGFTVEENLRLGASSLRASEVAPARDRVYGLLPELTAWRQRIAGTLSGGEQQLLAIGRALMMGPKLMLLDEPSFGLAPIMVRRLFETLTRLRRDTNLSLLLVEQNPQLVAGFADRAFLLESGRIAVTAAPGDPALVERLKSSHLALAV